MTMTCDDVRDQAAGFVLGVLSLDEAAAVRAHLASCDQPHAEFAELGGVVPYLADSLDPVEPPVGLRARLLAAAAADLADTATVRASVPATVRASVPAQASLPVPTSPIPFPSAAEREQRATARPSGRGTWMLRIAAVLAIAVLGGWNFQLQSRLSGVEGDLAAAQAYRAAVTAVLDAAAQPGAQSGFLAAAGPASRATGVVAATGGSVILAVENLAPTTGAQVYEAWVIVGDAAPVAIGGFEVGAGGTGVFRGSTAFAAPGAIVALTLEPAPGATAPTSPVVTLGTVMGAAG
ncbi:MAG: anti-sigma factor [Chloroflexota bacterium]